MEIETNVSPRQDGMTAVCGLLDGLGMRRRYRGFRYLAYAVTLALEDEDRLYGLTKRLYPEVARRFRTKPGSVEWDIRTLIGEFWEHGDRAALERLARRRLANRPSVGEMVDILMSHLLREMLF